MSILLNTTNLEMTSLALNAMLESAWFAPFSTEEAKKDDLYIGRSDPSLKMSDAVLSTDLSRSYFDRDGALSRRYPVGGQGETYIFRSNALVSNALLTPRKVLESYRSTRMTGSEKFIQDNEIYSVILHPNDLGNPREVHYRPIGARHNSSVMVKFGVTFYGKHVIAQNRFGGCGAACENMLRLDNKVTPDWEFQKECHLVNIEEIGTRLHRAGLGTFHIRYSFSHDAFGKRSLTNAVKRFGPMMVGIHGEAGGHFIVLDHFDGENNIAVIRDPFHGWAIATTADAILSRNVDQFLAVRRR